MSFESLIADKPENIKILAMQLKGLALKSDKHMHEQVYGGEKVKIALYNIGHINNVLFGIQPRAEYCLLYLHHTEKADTMSLKLEGKEGQTKHIKVTAIDAEMGKELKQVMKNIVKASKN